MTTGASGQKACILRTDEKHDAIWHQGLERVKSLCRAGSLTAAEGELARYKLDLVGVQEDRWGKVA